MVKKVRYAVRSTIRSLVENSRVPYERYGRVGYDTARTRSADKFGAPTVLFNKFNRNFIRNERSYNSQMIFRFSYMNMILSTFGTAILYTLNFLDC